MTKKKLYVAPQCTLYRIAVAQLCTSINDKEIDGSNAGLSRGFSGGVEDDSSNFLWEDDK